MEKIIAQDDLIINDKKCNDFVHNESNDDLKKSFIDKLDVESVNLCQIRELNLFCMGCCGHDYGSRDKLERAIDNNTQTYNEAKDKKLWGQRSPNYVHTSGVCYNVIRKGNEVFCPLHPLRNKGIDLRDKDCDINYMCLTYKTYLKWDLGKRKRFIIFLSLKSRDWYEYSMGMDSDSILNEFENLEQKNNFQEK